MANTAAFVASIGSMINVVMVFFKLGF